ncbi:MAG: hypothetical protein AVDCRST_MAG05-2380, partial [uncultured Rubrobacteraceae bacterium]
GYSHGEGERGRREVGGDHAGLLPDRGGPRGGAPGAERQVRAGHRGRLHQGAASPGRQQPGDDPGARGARRRAARGVPGARGAVPRRLHGPRLRTLLLLQGGPAGRQEGRQV